MLGLLAYGFLMSGVGVIVFIAVIIGGLFFVARLFRGKSGGTPSIVAQKNWYLYPALSKEDAVSQLFLLLAVLFFALSLFSFNQEWGQPFSWKTIVFIVAALSLAVSYVLKTIYSLALGLFLGAGWWLAESLQWTLEAKMKGAGLFAGLLLLVLIFYLIGRFHDSHAKWKRFGLVYFIFGLIPITGALFMFSTKPGLMFIQEMTQGVSVFGSWQIVLSLAVFIAVFISLVVYLMQRRTLPILEAAVLIFLAALFCVFMLLPQQVMFEASSRGYVYSYFSAVLTGAGVFWAVVFNILIFFELLGVIFSGYARKESWLINIGMIGLFLLIGFKYFDWFFTFLDKSLFFIGAGIFLLVIGWLMEKNRRRLIADIKSA